MKQEVVRELSTNEIRERLEEEKKQLIKLKLNHAVSPLENPNKIKAYRKTIARLVTEIRKRAIAEALSAKAGTNKSSLK
ncbi:MAG: 50S ribosomal protein L29 [Bacteroidales bacterium]